jgi:orotidine-5'-phosphate decarboxylase
LTATFADRLDAAVRDRSSQVVLGLDPDPAKLLPEAAAAANAETPAADATPSDRAARAVTAHCRTLIEATASACVAVKPQLACFERLGAPGWRALADVCAAARRAGLLVLADGKRGDVPHTAAAYAQALLGAVATPWGEVEGLDADAVTLNPLLGRDSIEPFLAEARPRGRGCFLLVRTSNPGAAELQDQSGEDCPPLHERLARLVDELGADGIGECGLSYVGAVVAATEPSLVARLRALMPRAIFLLPGIGVQGGRVEALGPAFEPGAAAALVAASRSIVGPALEAGSSRPALDAAEALRESAWALSGPAR